MIRGVQVIIKHKDKILIAKRSLFKKNGEPRIGAGRWNFIGGKIDDDETPFDTAIRETLEEAGIVLNDIIYLSEKINPWDLNYDPFYAYLFLAELKENVEVILNPEHSEFKWISPHEIDDFNLLGYKYDEIKDFISKNILE